MANPCAACKFLRRKCSTGCTFAPYFPADKPNKFANVHKVFGASNVAKLLNDLLPPQREDAVNSLSYEAEMRLQNPVYGCVAYISLLQLKIKQVEVDLQLAKKELSSYMEHSRTTQFLPPPILPSPVNLFADRNFSHLGINTGIGTGLAIGTGLGLGSPGVTSSNAEDLIRENQMLRCNIPFEGLSGGQEGPFMINNVPCQQGFGSGFMTEQPLLQTQFNMRSQMQAFMDKQHEIRVNNDQAGMSIGLGPSLPK